MAFIKKATAVFRLHPDYKKRVFGLDLMRAIAIIIVVLDHGILLEKANTNFPWIPLINGVELFFVLSGFLIGGILLKIFRNNPSFGLGTIVKFWIRRWFRTLPNYYLVLLLNIIVVYFGIIKEDFSQFNWKFFLFLQNFYSHFTGFFWESWSLSIEEWFYLLFPLILGLAFFIMKRFHIQKKNIYLSAIFIFLLIPFLLRVFIASRMDVDEFWLEVKIYKVVIYRIDSIALGLFAAYINFYYPVFWYKIRNISFVSGILISYLILYTSWDPNACFTKVFLIFLQSIGCLLLLPKFESIKKAPPTLLKIVTHISLISYSMYLLNLALVAEVIKTNFPPHGPRTAWALYGIYWITVLAFSTLLFKYFEKPMMDVRDKWKKDC
jgi:peptidoglycan/LPS O-acetylase OafA/YrhL